MLRGDVVAVAAVLLLACEPGAGGEARAPAAREEAAEPEAPAAAAPKVAFLGDSLTAGYTLPLEEAFPARLAELLAAAGRPITAVNAGVSGDTTAGGLARLGWVLAQRPDVLVVELGANDGLRGLPLEATEANLRAILRRGREAGASVVLLGLRLPPNYGAEYTAAFAAMYTRLAAEPGVAFVPFFLAGVAGHAELNLADGIHPNAAGHRRVAANLLPHLERALASLDERPAAGAR